jgi:hypothetical protein
MFYGVVLVISIINVIRQELQELVNSLKLQI